MRAPQFLALVALVACNGPKPSATPTQPAHAASAADACPDALPAVVATVAGTPITAEELASEGAGQLLEARMALYDARNQAMESMIIDRMVKKEIEARGVTEQELITAEVDAKISDPTDAEIEAFYTANQGQMRGAPLEDMRGPIASHLQQQQAGDLTRAFIQSLEDKYEVQRNLEPLRVDVAAGSSARLGSADAPITIVEFSDFQCPYCTTAAATVKEVLAKYGDKVSLVYRHFPLPMHRQAGKAAEGAECAREQDEAAFWSYHDALFADQKPWSNDDLIGYAEELELDVQAFTSCLNSGRHAATVMKDVEEGQAVGMSGTPGFYVNGMVISGAQPASVFIDLIDRELARVGG